MIGKALDGKPYAGTSRVRRGGGHKLPLLGCALLAALNAAALADEDEDEFTPSNDEDFEMDEIDPEGFDFTEG